MNKQTKTVILSIIGFIFTITLWWSLKHIFLNFSWTYFTIAVIALLFGLSFWLLSIWLGSKWITVTIMLVSLFSLFIFFKLTYLYAIAFIIVLIGFLIAENVIAKEEELRNKIEVDEVVSGGLRAILVTFWVLISVMFYYSPYSNVSNLPANDFIKDKVLAYYLPGFSSNLTLNDFSLTLAAKGQGISSSSEVKQYIAKQKLIMSQDDLNTLRNAYLEKLQLDPTQYTGDETIGSTHIIDKIINDTLNPMIKKMGVASNIGASVMFYLLLSWLVGQIASLLILLVTWIFFKIFIATKFIVIKKEMVESESIKM